MAGNGSGACSHRLKGTTCSFLVSVVALVLIGCRPPDAESIERYEARLAEAWMHQDAGHYTMAEQSAREFLPFVEETFGKNAAATADVIDLLVMSLDRQGRQRESPTLEWAQRAVGIRESVGRETPGMARSLQNLAVLVWIRRDIDSARKLLEQALEIRRTTLGERDRLVAQTMDTLGMLLLVAGDSEAGQQLLDDALALRIAILPATHPDIGESHASIGGVQLMFGKYEDARPYLEQATSIHLAAWDEPHPRAGTSAHNLATACQFLGDFDCARTNYEHALRIRDAALSPGHHLRATTHESYASLLHATGDYARARFHYRRALAEFEGREIVPTHELAHTLYNLGLLLAESGDLPEALVAHRRALELRRGALAPDDLRIVESESKLGCLLIDSGEVAEGRQLLQSAFGTLEATESLDTVSAVIVRIGLAAVARHDGNSEEARELLEAAVAIREREYGSENLAVVWPYRQLGELLLSMGEPRAADGSFRRALGVIESNVGRGSPHAAPLLAACSRALAAQDDVGTAIALALESARIGREHLALTIRGMAERQALLYRDVMNVGLDLAQTFALEAPDRSAVRDVWEARIRARALVFDELVRKNRLLSLSQSPEHSEAILEYRRATTRLANVLVRIPRGASPAQHRQLIADARRSHEMAERRIGELTLDIPAGDSKSTGADTIAAELPPGSSLVAYTVFRRHEGEHERQAYGAFVLRHPESYPVFHLLGPTEEIDPLVEQWQAAVSTPDAEYRSVGTELRSRIWDPLGISTPDSGATVFLVPDGALNLINFATLPANRGGFLIDTRLKFHHLTSERDLAASVPTTDAGTALIFGGIDFDHAGETVEQVGATSARTSGFRGDTSDCEDFKSVRFPPLAGTGREAREIAELWRSMAASSAGSVRGATLVMGASASEDTFKRMASRYRTIHIATHGFFLNGSCQATDRGRRGFSIQVASDGPSPLAQTSAVRLRLSGLAFAGANDRLDAEPDEEDGVLTAEEVGAMDLRGVDLVVLSACETGLGDPLIGEGVRGLQRSFRVAGARAVVMSLWNVSDEAALRWMTGFYEHRIGASRPLVDAVFSANLEYLEFRRNSGSSDHPFYWGAFVASGDWR